MSQQGLLITIHPNPPISLFDGIVKVTFLSLLKYSLHMPGVAKVNSALGRALVRPVLQRDHILASLQLLLAEVAHVLLGLLGSDGRFAKVSGLPAQRLQADNDRVQVLTLPQVHALEGLLRWHSHLLGNFEEV